MDRCEHTTGQCQNRRICRYFADVAQLVEHFTRKRVQRWPGIGRTMAQQSRFAASSCVAARPVKLSYVIALGPVWARLAVSAQYGPARSRRPSAAATLRYGKSPALRPRGARCGEARLSGYVEVPLGATSGSLR